jgi:hypothetical protein
MIARHIALSNVDLPPMLEPVNSTVLGLYDKFGPSLPSLHC